MFSSYTCNRRSHLWDYYVEPGEAFCYFLRTVSPTGCLVLPLSGTRFFSFLLLSVRFLFFLLKVVIIICSSSQEGIDYTVCIYIRVLPLKGGSCSRFRGGPEDDTRDPGRFPISQDFGGG